MDLTSGDDIQKKFRKKNKADIHACHLPGTMIFYPKNIKEGDERMKTTSC